MLKDRKDLCYEGLFKKPLTQLCRWSWCLYIMCICTLTSHSNYTACPCAVDLCTQPFALEKCVIARISWSLGIWEPNCWYGSPGSSAHLARTKVLPQKLSTNLFLWDHPLPTQHKTPLYLPVLLAWCFILLEISKWVLEICTNVHPPLFHNTHLRTF